MQMNVIFEEYQLFSASISMLPSLYYGTIFPTNYYYNMKSLLLILSLFLLNVSAQVFTKLSETKGEAKDKTYDVLHYKIEISFDETKKMVIGTTTTTFVPYGVNFTAVEFDAEDMTFKSVTMGKKPLKYDSLAASIKIYLDKPYTFKDTVTVSID